MDSLHIPFDLCINARNGLYNSRLIAAYAELHPYVRPMIVILKAWARSSGVDAPPQVINKGRKTIGVPRPFSSYILGLLVVAYLQVCKLNLSRTRAGLTAWRYRGCTCCRTCRSRS